MGTQATIKKMDMHAVMQKLSEKRTIFHFETDFQLALFREIQSLYKPYKIILEYPLKSLDPSPTAKGSVDIFVQFDSHNSYPIELKYKTDEFSATVEDEQFYLKGETENKNGRDSFYRDVSRLEKAAKHGNFKEGYAIFLTNLSYYRNYKLDCFSMHEGAKLAGVNEWPESAKHIRTRGPVEFDNEHTISWRKYSEIKTQDCVGQAKNRSFYYALISV